jgi:hypothetical protein
MGERAEGLKSGRTEWKEAGEPFDRFDELTAGRLRAYGGFQQA